MRPRSLARRLALQYLHMVDLRGVDNVEPSAGFFAAHADAADVHAFATELVEAVLTQHTEIDAEISAAADNWSLARLGSIERNALRIGCAELRLAATPDKVILDEAVRLAKLFGGKDSGGFVNGVLDRIYAQRKAATDD